jgi:hypothetical protein
MSLAHLIPITALEEFTAEHFPPSFSVLFELQMFVSFPVANQFEKNQGSRDKVEGWKETECRHANCYLVN